VKFDSVLKLRDSRVELNIEDRLPDIRGFGHHESNSLGVSVIILEADKIQLSNKIFTGQLFAEIRFMISGLVSADLLGLEPGVIHPVVRYGLFKHIPVGFNFPSHSIWDRVIPGLSGASESPGNNSS
jgi:hypothetical protein